MTGQMLNETSYAINEGQTERRQSEKCIKNELTALYRLLFIPFLSLCQQQT
jgi:hypothetical protein